MLVFNVMVTLLGVRGWRRLFAIVDTDTNGRYELCRSASAVAWLLGCIITLLVMWQIAHAVST